MESLLATWSCPSQPFQPVVTPCRKYASNGVRERLNLVSGRRDEATAAWEAWRKAKEQAQSCHVRLQLVPRRGAELESSEREEWKRVKNYTAREAVRRQIMIDRELKQLALQMHSNRVDRVEAGRAARAAATRLRRAKEDSVVVESRRKARLRILRRQLKQLSELDTSPFLLETLQISLPEESRPGGIKLGSIPASIRHGHGSSKLSSRGDNSQGDTLRKRQDAVKRMRPAELVAEFRHKRDVYLGSRVRTVSAQLVGRPSPSLCLIEEPPKGCTTKASSDRSSQPHARTDEEVVKSSISANNETVVLSNAKPLCVVSQAPAPPPSGERQISEASEEGNEYEEDYDDDYEDDDEFGTTESEEHHSASVSYECEQSEIDTTKPPLETPLVAENECAGCRDEPSLNINTPSDEIRPEPGNAVPSSALETREDFRLDNEEDQANYDDDFEERAPVAGAGQSGLWTDDEDEENEPALYADTCGTDVSTDTDDEAESGAKDQSDQDEQPSRQ